jgi:hypothetical protein
LLDVLTENIIGRERQARFLLPELFAKGKTVRGEGWIFSLRLVAG